ncbi:hypothetical protein [Roseiterribacter gracilis]|uniref:Extradiol ring-cleavage dioxygenase class III enzyme subunit B domain-containing protein n=1 Tax=Roseiterribacter gracilis TaxID=2812848 RepID=A0A8S8XBY8_9PROT|nr:hypothetical protein TMPK1_13760 [Rhodospirillales bacterium TMPK1]
MAQIVAAYVMPHDPIMFTHPEAPAEDVRARVAAAYGEIARRIGALGATAAIVVGTDHYILFGPQCLPQMLIGVGDVEGPIEKLPGLPRGPIENHEPMAEAILAGGFADGFDWTVSRALTVDHSISIPYQLAIQPNSGVRTVPIYLACGVRPMIDKARAFALGASIGRAIAAMHSDDRVVIIGSGGISHWVGTAEMGTINPRFDGMVLDCVERNDAASLIGLSDALIEREAGNGALEIRTFLCAMGAVGRAKGEVIAYEPVPEWVTGLGFAELRAV